MSDSYTDIILSNKHERMNTEYILERERERDSFMYKS